MNDSRVVKPASRCWVWVGVFTAALAVIGVALSFFFRTNCDKSAIRDAAAAHLHVASNKVTVERYATHGACAVAEISAVGPPRKTYIVATRRRDGVSAVTHTATEHFFDTDDPDWAFTCP